MRFDFDHTPDRRGSDCYKWDAEPPVPLTEAEKEDLIPLWVADMDFQAAPCILEALRRRLDHGVFGYEKVPGRFYDAIIGWFSRRHGWDIPREAILYTTGVVPAISAVLKALTVPGDKVLVQTPVYNCFFSSIRNLGCRIEDSPLRLVPGRSLGADAPFEARYRVMPAYEIDFEDFAAKAADPAVKVFLLCNPHNPAGRVWTREELGRLADICRRHGVIVVSDEIHCELTAPGVSYTPFATVDSARDNCVCLGSPSKSFNIAGLQCAHIICERADWRERIDRALNIHEVCDVNPFAPEAVISAYDEGGPWLDALNAYIWDNYRFLADFFARALPDFPVTRLEGTYLAWVDIRALGDRPSAEVEKELLKRLHVWVNAGSMYGTEGFIRINLACPRSRLAAGTERLIKGLKRLKNTIL